MNLKLAAAGIFLVTNASQTAVQETAPVYIFSTLAGSAGVARSADGAGAAARLAGSDNTAYFGARKCSRKR
jgi:hypothetical protein